MKKHIFLLEKIVLFLFYLESMVFLSIQHKRYFWLVVGMVSIISYIYQGARPYTPLFFLVALADYYQLDILQMSLVVILGFLVVYLKFYHIEIVGKGPYNAGYKYYKHNEIQLSIFYPSMADGDHPKWIPSESYSRTFYDIAYVNPQETRLPFRLFSFLVSFLFKMKMPVLGDASLYVNDHQKAQSWSLIVFSHGLGSNMNNYSALCGWWASHGYIVVSIQHSHDLVRIQFPKHMLKQLDSLQKLFYNSRNNDLIVRTKQMDSILTEIIDHNLLDSIFNNVKKINIASIYLSGHSFGGTTALETMANRIQSNRQSELIKGLICLDAWFFPLSSSTYDNLVNQNILLINSETFFGVVPFFYYMEQKMARIKKNNETTMKAFMIKKTDHLSISDFVFAFGNLFGLLKTVSLQEYAQPIVELHEILISLFIEGETQEKMIQISNQYIKKTKLPEKNVQVLQQWRYQRRAKEN